MQHLNHPIAEDLLGDRQYRRLLDKHEELETRLQEVQAGPAVDWDGVKLVKRDKLRVAEALEELRRQRH